MDFRETEIAVLFRQQAPSLKITIEDRPHTLVFDVRVDEKPYRARALSSSRDFYEHRLNINGDALTMLIVGQHNTRAPHAVLALDEGYLYAPMEAPRWYNPDATRTNKDAMVVIGGLLSGVDEAWQQVQAMKRATRYRYLARMKTYLSMKPGGQVLV